VRQRGKADVTIIMHDDGDPRGWAGRRHDGGGENRRLRSQWPRPELLAPGALFRAESFSSVPAGRRVPPPPMT
jgi:hypothetical protein